MNLGSNCGLWCPTMSTQEDTVLNCGQAAPLSCVWPGWSPHLSRRDSTVSRRRAHPGLLSVVALLVADQRVGAASKTRRVVSSLGGSRLVLEFETSGGYYRRDSPSET